MASLERMFSYGSVQIYSEEVLGIGAYGKVCKAKCGQLPCAAKLLHDTLFQDNDPGTQNLITKFLQECQFLSTIKHPNIVQYLGTARDPQSRRPVLLMELMDESLTRFLERLTATLPYHSQLNICHDVALALAYLHSNDIIHRDLSSNNVLLIGEGSRAKVTDFGMSKLVDMNPRMTPLTQVPGTPAYMPPEAFVAPPHYSSKLDCFSHGVLTLQIITRNFPNPGDASRYVEDPRYPAGRVLVQFLEGERRKKDIDLIEPSHPLLPIALDCLKDRDTERPSADELCGRLASLSGEPPYTHSVEQTRGHRQRLQEEISTKDAQLQAANEQLHTMDGELQGAYLQLHTKDSELQGATEQLHRVDDELQRATEQLHRKDDELQGATEQLHRKDHELQGATEQLHRVDGELQGAYQQLHTKDGKLQGATEQLHQMDRELQGATEQLHRVNGELQLANERNRRLQEQVGAQQNVAVSVC
jgi:serine/threonine-protein kinase TNNI3K